MLPPWGRNWQLIYPKNALFKFHSTPPGKTNSGGMVSTIDLHIKVASFVKNVNNIFNIKWADLK
jgi:hypothetical protein